MKFFLKNQDQINIERIDQASTRVRRAKIRSPALFLTHNVSQFVIIFKGIAICIKTAFKEKLWICLSWKQAEFLKIK